MLHQNIFDWKCFIITFSGGQRPSHLSRGNNGHKSTRIVGPTTLSLGGFAAILQLEGESCRGSSSCEGADLRRVRYGGGLAEQHHPGRRPSRPSQRPARRLGAL